MKPKKRPKLEPSTTTLSHEPVSYDLSNNHERPRPSTLEQCIPARSLSETSEDEYANHMAALDLCDDSNVRSDLYLYSAPLVHPLHHIVDPISDSAL